MNPLAWALPYMAQLLRLDEHLLNFMMRSSDQRQWVGMMEALIALAYNRFRPGAKLKINGFRITNDHRHQFHIMDYSFDLQGLKRSLPGGGQSSDMLNLKAPVYYSYQILAELAPEHREILITLAQESVNSMMKDTYKTNLAAQEVLRGLQLTLKHLASPDFEPESTLEEYLCLRTEYQDHPLTQYNLSLWREHKEEMAVICQSFRRAQDLYFQGGAYEEELERVRTVTEEIRGKMINYWEDMTHI